MRFGRVLIAAAIQLVVFFLPIAAGVSGLISGGMAGLTAVIGWFVIGIPFSYALIDSHARAQERSSRPVRTSAPLAHPVDLR